MKEVDIRKYAELMKEFDLSGLEITEDNKVVRLERNLTVAGKEQVFVPSTVATDPIVTAEPKQDYISVKSPMVGVFYVAPAENAEPFVKIGDKVEKGKTLCIIESMKLMNEIPADVEGTIEKVCVTNGQVVEYGAELFRIRR